MKGGLIILSAPSGAGKTTIEQFILSEIPNVVKVITCTTRKPRKNEVNGKDYIFLTEGEFKKLIEEDYFLEYAIVHGRYYGTPKEKVLEEINRGNDVLLNIDVQGAMTIKNKYSSIFSITSIFIIPPSIDELIRRLEKRGETKEEIERRLKSLEKELPKWKYYDFIVINDILEKAKDDVKRIILSQRLKTDRFNLSIIKDEKLKKLMEI